VALHVSRLTPTGAVGAQADVPVPFGGGLSSVFVHLRAPKAMPLSQSGFHAARAFARPDGGVVLPGAVAVIQYTGEGAGYETEQAAVASVTPAFAVDSAFGGPAQPAKIRVRLTKQRATVDAKRLRVSITATTSSPGLALLTVKAGKRTIARSTAPVFASGTQRLPALLTLTGRRALKHAHRLRVTVTASFRDLMGSRASARTRGTLR
jgi:hypothetical protein